MAVPTEAREMHASLYEREPISLPKELTFILESVQNEAVGLEAASSLEATQIDPLQHLLKLAKQEAAVITAAVEEQTIARTLLFRFGLPYLPGAEEVWLTLSEYLTNAKNATEQAQLQLKQAIDKIKALLISQLTISQEKELAALEVEEEKHYEGIVTLQKTSTTLAEEGELVTQKDKAVTQKKERLSVILTQKREIKNSIESMRAMMSNLIISFAKINQFDQTQLVMA